METSNRFQYDVFISYSRKDYQKDNPDYITNKIIKLFDENNVRYFFDQSDIMAGDAYAALITPAIIGSKYFLFISTENANSSNWTKKEVALAIHYDKAIIPVRADRSHYDSSVAFYLADIDYIDGIDHNITIERLTKSIVLPIKQEAEAKELEYKKKKEIEIKEKAKKEKEQEQLVGSIKLDIAQLDSDEKSVEIKREKIKLQINKVENEDTKTELSALLNQTGTIYKSIHNQMEKIISEKDKQIEEIKRASSLNQEKSKREVDKQEYHSDPQDNKSKFDFFKYHKNHSVITVILAYISIIALLGISIFNTIWLESYSEAYEWSICLLIGGLTGSYLLFLMFRKYRISPIIHITYLILLGILIYWESSIQQTLYNQWSTTFYQEDTIKYIPIPALLMAAYLLGLSSFLIVNKKTGRHSLQNLRHEKFIDFLNPKKHIGLLVILLIIFLIL
jgi:hypothetical protein